MSVQQNFTRWFPRHVIVHGDSMRPNLAPGQHCLVLPYSFLTRRAPKRGEVVLAHDPRTQHLIIKRVAGLPNEALVLRSGVRLRAGEQEYFLIGDNQEHSTDSRMYGPVARKSILGFIVQPSLDTPST